MFGPSHPPSPQTPFHSRLGPQPRPSALSARKSLQGWPEGLPPEPRGLGLTEKLYRDVPREPSPRRVSEDLSLSAAPCAGAAPWLGKHGPTDGPKPRQEAEGGPGCLTGVVNTIVSSGITFICDQRPYPQTSARSLR